MVRCRGGVVQDSASRTIPDQRCTTPRVRAARCTASVARVGKRRPAPRGHGALGAAHLGL